MTLLVLLVGCWISCSHSRMLLLAWSLEPENSTASHLWCENFTGYQSGKGSDLRQPFWSSSASMDWLQNICLEYCKLMTGRSHLRSANTCLLSVPCTRTTYGDRSFAVSGPVAWNSLPVALHSSDVTEETFRRHWRHFCLTILTIRYVDSYRDIDSYITILPSLRT